MFPFLDEELDPELDPELDFFTLSLVHIMHLKVGIIVNNYQSIIKCVQVLA